MGLIRKAKKIMVLGRQLRRVKEEMKEIGVRGVSPKAQAKRTGELVKKLKEVKNTMVVYELGVLSAEADKEGRELLKLITLAEAQEKVAKAKVRVAEAKERLKPKHKPIEIIMPKITVGVKRKTTPKRKALPKRRASRITPKRPKLRR